ncbi:hypothetical protein [Pseudaestuariivita rosea]|uniref:hypothetical protein n=1 Tax=Pseudaestuariivita rosea TaxID=2763263 RepID=UPI001ABB2A2D|nr:hypothetical protein [Pseudaestuariivita rosea]
MAKTDGDTTGFTVEEAPWGYTIRANFKEAWVAIALQVASWAFATACILASVALWFAPSTTTGPYVVYIKFGTSVLLATLGMLLLSYSVRGRQSEFQVDTKKGEIREVVPNKSGAPTELSCYDFRDLNDVIIRQIQQNSKAETLLLSYKNGMHFVPLVSGSQHILENLKDRILADLAVPETPKPSFQKTSIRTRLFGQSKDISDAA